MDISFQKSQTFTLYDDFLQNDYAFDSPQKMNYSYESPQKTNYDSENQQISPSPQSQFFEFSNFDEYCLQNDDQNFNKFLFHQNKRIGILTLEERQRKIEIYKNKRQSRVWIKKINYDCRKRVADQRIRVKGRFITKDQAKQLKCNQKQ